MKIAWLADYTFKTNCGGAQITNDMYIKSGKKRGLKITQITPGDVLDYDFDLYIINNLTRFIVKDINELIENVSYMIVSHDYYLLENISKYPKIFEYSLVNMFMSRMHAKEYVNRLKIKNVDYNTSPVDVKKFKINKKIKKKNNLVIWIGGIHPYKGLNNILSYAKNNPEKNFKLVIIRIDNPNSLPKSNLENVEFLCQMDQYKLITLYQKADYVIALPNWIEPTGRSVLEGYLCGCNLIVNKNVGFMGEDWNWNDYEEIREKAQSDDLFWERIGL